MRTSLAVLLLSCASFHNVLASHRAHHLQKTLPSLPLGLWRNLNIQDSPDEKDALIEGYV